MAELVTDWRAWLGAFAVLGVAPGVVLRLLVLAYPRSHPRRRELLAELRAIDVVHRPLWVLGQIETLSQEAPAARRATRGVRMISGEPHGRERLFLRLLRDVALSLAEGFVCAGVAAALHAAGLPRAAIWPVALVSMVVAVKVEFVLTRWRDASRRTQTPA